ncbi:esterase-like activity of phytase family protein [Sinisalibacter lacisalsi]|uniref:Alkaline phosphatase n=1 Tax=Sinisalibacter lacisalsi TaxID=1526570 RepID=A0ABQ1QHA7_9RHOB|nr:esterase-like activity of phytase family protein [Sinisalibacter lacisalsi]GGD26283.1 alkaline phosphatase [Sinisalibacter lacisalsi]
MKATLLTLTSALALMAGAANAEMNFNRIASFPVASNMAEGEDVARESSAEIIAASADGMTLAYSDSPLGVIGLVDITDPANPLPLGNITLDGEPTAVSTHGNTVFAGVNTSESYIEPSGYLLHIDLATGTEAGRCDLGGQPDSTAVAPDGAFVTVAIENERDEDAGDGRVPQMPAGWVAIVPLDGAGMMLCDQQIRADVTGLAEIAPEDPEPEFVDVNAAGEIVVTLQENNHIVVLSSTGEVVSHFSAGAVDLEGIDATDERAALIFDESQAGVVREPDGIQWIDNDHFVTANEGDMDGGSRGFTVFRKDGTVVHESGPAFEHAVVQIGHYPDRRSDAKGVEPEGMEFAVFGGTPYLFLLAERASVVGVYDMTDPANPVLKQLLPSGISPEGAVAIPERNLLATANEFDGIEDGAARAHVMLYEYQDAAPAYPHLTSAGMDELTGWGAISGMVADEGGIVWAVNDSFYGYQPTIFKIDTSATPARIVDAIGINRAGRPAQKLDIEGITLDGEGGFWLASEGRTDRVIPHALYHVNAEGEIKQEIGLPAALMAVEKRFGFEGITKVGDTLWMAVQREWADDPENHVKLLAYNTESGEWGAVHYEKTAPDYGWVGLSEITAHGDWVYLVERDNQLGTAAVTKLVTRVPASEMVPAALGGELPVVSREVVRDLIADLTSTGGYVLDKVEGLAIAADGTAWISTDNDGVDDHSGETMFFTIGTLD